MVEFVNQVTCLFRGCHKLPFYNLPGIPNGIFCKEHKSHEMINVRRRVCCFDGCSNYISEKTLQFCKDHSYCEYKDTSENLDENRAVHNRLPPKSFSIPLKNYPKPSTYSSDTKTFLPPSTNRLCGYHDCKRIPRYNLPSEESALFCVQHKTEEMVMMESRTNLCHVVSCNK